LTNFEMKFKVKKHRLSYLNPKRSNSWFSGWFSSFNLKQEEVARDEEEALDKISTILSNLTSKRTAMVCRLHHPLVSFSCWFCVQYHWLLTICIRSQRRQEICRTQVCNSLRNCS
jgi:hypothetical protein